MRLRGSRKVFISVAVAVLLGATGVAVAYWTSSGSGSGAANTGTGSAVTVHQTVSPTGLYPGGAAALSGDFDNPNSGNVYVGAVTASVTPFNAQADGTKPACTQADFSITGSATVNATITPGNGVGSWSGLALDMSNTGTNQDNCKNVSVPITYTST